MSLNTTRTCLAVLALAGGLALAGCTTHKKVVHAEIIVQPMPNLAAEPLYTQVAWVELSDHGVAFRFDGYRHVITHGEPSGWYTPNVGEPKTVESGTPLPTDSGPRVTGSRLTLYASTPEEMEAWKIWCSGEDITEAQYEIIVGTRLPPDAPFPCDEFHRTVWRK